VSLEDQSSDFLADSRLGKLHDGVRDRKNGASGERNHIHHKDIENLQTHQEMSEIRILERLAVIVQQAGLNAEQQRDEHVLPNSGLLGTEGVLNHQDEVNAQRNVEVE